MNRTIRVLAIDPAHLLNGWSPPENIEVLRTETVDSAVAMLRGTSLKVVVLAAPTTGEACANTLARIHEADCTIPIIVSARSVAVDEAVHLTKRGAFHCLTIAELDTERGTRVITAASEQCFSAQLVNCREQMTPEPWRRFLIGESRSMRQVAEIIRLIACRRSTVLITGETGTGKEVVARALHAASNRSSRPMVSVNCGAIPETLIEAELFGHTKGAFTGASGMRVGRFEQANGSTLFLDEIAELPYEMQAKLLRVLQERELQRLGSSDNVQIDVRFVAAANVDLEQAIADRKFRQDLYYRLNVVPLRLAPVRERKDDIPLLVEHFINKICGEDDVPPKIVSHDALDKLCEYHWPGNVRQIEHAIEMAVALSGSRSVLTAQDFNLPVPTVVAFSASAFELPDRGLSFDETVGRVERSLLEQALAKANGNKGRAADLLRLKRTTFLAKLKAFDIAADNGKQSDDCGDLVEESSSALPSPAPVM
jgi:DNA-binding NtrC family response regulator